MGRNKSPLPPPSFFIFLNSSAIKKKFCNFKLLNVPPYLVIFSPIYFYEMTKEKTFYIFDVFLFFWQLDFYILVNSIATVWFTFTKNIKSKKMLTSRCCFTKRRFRKCPLYQALLL